MLESSKIELKVQQQFDYFNARSWWVISEMECGSEVDENPSNLEQAFNKMQAMIAANPEKYESFQTLEGLKERAFSFDA